MNYLKRITFAPLTQLLIRPSSSTTRQSKILKKLVVGKERAKRRWYQEGSTPKFQSAASLSNPAKQGKNAPRRVHVLNKLFMKHITDLLSTGEVSEAVLGRGLEVSHVKVSADFNYVNVFWCAKGTMQTDDEMEVILHRAAGILRHELSQLRLMGEVPRINFVRDRQHSSYAEVQDLLSRADFGDDFVPTTWAQVRHDLDPHAQQTELELPVMRHDVLGLDRADIMDRIKGKMAKNRQAWDRFNAVQTDASTNAATSPDASSAELSSNGPQDEILRLREEEFTHFLEQRRNLKKIRRGRKNPDFNEPYERNDFDDVEEFDRWEGGGDFIEEDPVVR